jgi:glucose 1-dehydrogenase
MKLQDKVAVVTGANRGIGRGIALEMARHGADVVINYRSHADEAEQVAGQVRDLGRRALVVQCDVAKRDQVDALVRQAAEQLGGVDICVANAANTRRAPFLELSNQAFQEVLDVSLLGVFSTMQACARQMVRQGRGGAILAISSVHATIPFATCVAYNTAKAGINHMAATAAEELRPHHIRVNVLEPGWIDTPGERQEFDAAAFEKAGRTLPWGRHGTEQEMGAAAVFLCGDDASYITAATLRADGGFWLPSRKAASVD